MRPEFTCHHCAWALRANVEAAFMRGLIVGGAAAIVAFGALVLVFGPSSTAVWALVEFGGFVWLAFGATVYRRALALTPIRPQRKVQAAEGP